MGHSIQHPHGNQTGGGGEVMENHFSPRGTWVCSYSHCHPQTAITFLFTGFLETYSNLPLNFAPSLQVRIR